MKGDQSTIDNKATKNRVLAEVLDKLKRRQYKLKFRREATRLYCPELNEWISIADFTVDQYYYFEDILNPDAERILYAISISQERKGFLIETCNVYVDNISLEMMEKLKFNKIRKRKDDLFNAGKMKNPARLLNTALIF